MTKSSPGRTQRRRTAKAQKWLPEGPPDKARQHYARTKEASLEIPLDRLGYPGTLTTLHIVPQFPTATRSDLDILTDHAERTFEAAALLSKAPSPASALNFHFEASDGESYFTFAPPRMAVDTLWGRVMIDKNARGEAAMVSMTCRAISAEEALSRLQLACASFLDHWSYEATAPVYLTRHRVRDLASEVTMARFSSPFRQAVINPVATEIPTPLRAILALYREGLGSASPIYRFLCFYKILEGYFTRLKPDLAKIFKSARLPYPVGPDLVPDHPDLDVAFRIYVGQSITKFRDELLTPSFRDAVAHFEKTGLSPLVMSSPSQIVRFTNSALAVDLCARAVIEAYRTAFRSAMAAGLDLSSLAEISEEASE